MEAYNITEFSSATATAEGELDQPRGPSSLPVRPSPTVLVPYFLAHTSDTTSTSRC
jgi:hypothetical protein